MSSKTFSATGIILKRTNIGETDKVVLMLTQEMGKFACVAKGVRKVTSSKRAFLEPGNIVKGFFVSTKNMPLMTQATLTEDCSKMEPNLTKIRQLTQVLEILDRLFVEEELESQVYGRVLALRAHTISNESSAGHVKAYLNALINDLGFQDPKDSNYRNISEYVAALSDKPLKSFDYLTVK